MKKLIPFNNIVLVQLLENTEKKVGTIVVPDRHIGRFIRLKVLASGSLVEHINNGDIVLANATFEIIDPSEPTIGFINSRDILAKEVV